MIPICNKASYKTELLYLWERWHGTIQELDKTRDQLTISEKRIETLITDSDERHSKIIEDHKHEVNIAEKSSKEKLEKVRKTMKDEIEFLENSIQSQRESYDEQLRHVQDSELQLKRRNNEFQAEVKDLRDQITDLKLQIEDFEQANRLNSSRLSLDGSKTGRSRDSELEIETSLMAEEYENYIRDLQDKIDEQNTTINSLKDQMEESLNRSMSQMRKDPEGEEDFGRSSFQSDEDSYEQVLKLHLGVTSTPSHINANNNSMAEEIRTSGMTPRRIGPLLHDQEDISTQTEAKVYTFEGKVTQTEEIGTTDTTVQCILVTQRESELESEVQSLQEEVALKKKLEDRMRELEEKSTKDMKKLTDNEEEKINLNELLKVRDEEVKVLIEQNDMGREKIEEIRLQLKTLEGQLRSKTEDLENTSKITEEKSKALEEMAKLKDIEIQHSERIEILNGQVDDKNKEIETLNGKVDALESEIKKMSSAHAEDQEQNKEEALTQINVSIVRLV